MAVPGICACGDMKGGGRWPAEKIEGSFAGYDLLLVAVVKYYLTTESLRGDFKPVKIDGFNPIGFDGFVRYDLLSAAVVKYYLITESASSSPAVRIFRICMLMFGIDVR